MNNSAPVPPLQEQIAALLRTPLPGSIVQLRMAPHGQELHEFTPPLNQPLRQAAVLLLLYPQPEGMSVIFTLRPTTLKHHAGEISFPGGAREPHDASLQYTALREGYEELGVAPDTLSVLGALTPLYIPPSRNLVHPFVGWLTPPAVFRPQAQEVAQILAISLRHLRRPDTITRRQWAHHGIQIDTPCYIMNDQCIWGATAMMLSEFLAIIAPLPETQL